jgi:hypothetical protein
MLFKHENVRQDIADIRINDSVPSYNKVNINLGLMSRVGNIHLIS